MDPIELRHGLRLAAVAMVCAIVTAAVTIGVGRQFVRTQPEAAAPVLHAALN